MLSLSDTQIHYIAPAVQGLGFHVWHHIHLTDFVVKVTWADATFVTS